MKKSEIIERTRNYVKTIHNQETSGHDWWHIARVTELAKQIGKKENADPFITEMAALLHDIGDEKLNESEEKGLEKVSNWLRELEIDGGSFKAIMEIVSKISFKGGHNRPFMESMEGKVVQDADRLDAIGAIGIARAFTYAGSKGSLIYDPNIQSRETMTQIEYRTGKSSAIHHFYEKLLKLKDLMNTETGLKIAEKRHLILEAFLEDFLNEWNGILK